MHKKRKYTITIGIIGLILAIVFLIQPAISGKTIESNITGTNITSRVLGGLGILLMIIAVVIENYELNKLKREKISKNK